MILCLCLASFLALRPQAAGASTQSGQKSVDAVCWRRAAIRHHDFDESVLGEDRGLRRSELTRWR